MEIAGAWQKGRRSMNLWDWIVCRLFNRCGVQFHQANRETIQWLEQKREASAIRTERLAAINHAPTRNALANSMARRGDV